MRRFLLTLMALLLPLQLAWAQTSSYCFQDGDTQALVQTHHDEQRQSCHDSGGDDADHCHHACHHLSPLLHEVLTPPCIDACPPTLASALPRPSAPPDERPERPNWHALA